MGGPDPSELTKPNIDEKASTEVAVKQFNAFLAGKPEEKDFLADISRDPSLTSNAAKGEAAADLAGLNAGVMPNNPNMNSSANTTGMMRLAAKRAKIGNELDQDAISQQAAGKKTYLENAMGIQSTANMAQAGLASDAVSRNLARTQADYESSAANAGALSSAAGSGMAFYLNRNQGVKTK